MSSVIDRPTKRAVKQRLTLGALHNEILRLRQRIEDLEDLRELNQAMERNGARRLIPWSKAKKELGLD